MHDDIFRPWFDVAHGPFEPFVDRRWGTLIYAEGLGLDRDAAAVLARIVQWPVAVREVPVTDDTVEPVTDLAALNTYLLEPRTAVEIRDAGGRWGAIVSQVDGFTLIAAAADAGVPADAWARNHARFREHDAVHGGIGFGAEGRRFVENDLLPLLRAPSE